MKNFGQRLDYPEKREETQGKRRMKPYGLKRLSDHKSYHTGELMAYPNKYFQSQ